MVVGRTIGLRASERCGDKGASFAAFGGVLSVWGGIGGRGWVGILSFEELSWPMESHGGP